MERFRECLCLKAPSSLVFPKSSVLSKLPSRLWLKAKGHASFGPKQATKKRELVSLYKDKELCEGYADIEIMWKMIHSTYSTDVRRNVTCKRPRYSVFCFKPS